MVIPPPLPDALFRDKVLRARKIPPERKLLAPARLFDYTRSISLAAIRRQHPDASNHEIREIFRRRQKLARHLDSLPLDLP